MRTKNGSYTESGLKLLGLDLASLVTQGVGAGAQPNAYTGYGISVSQTFLLGKSKILFGVLLDRKNSIY